MTIIGETVDRSRVLFGAFGTTNKLNSGAFD